MHYCKRPLCVEVADIKYRPPGISEVSFEAEYKHHKRRGIIMYDTVNKQFLSHNSDITLLAAVCRSLQNNANVGG